ncbi:MAG: L-lysine 6-transaminase [Chloroflexota bacterium]
MRVQPNDVHTVLAKSILADGDPYVLDLARSHGPWLVDARTGVEYLDFGSGYASTALTYNHPNLTEPEFEKRLLNVARHKPANSDRYTVELAEFVNTVATHVIPESHPYIFFVEGGAGAVENALKVAFDWKVRKNLAAGNGERGTQIMHFRNAFHGRLGYTLSLTNTADPRKYMYFPKFTDWPRFDPPKLSFPITDEIIEQVAAEEERVLGEMEAYLEEHAIDVAGIIIEPIQGEGGDQHLRPEFFKGLRDLADRYDVLLIYDEIQTGMGLTGSWWYFQQLGVAPDVFAFAKKMQVGGIAASRRLDEVENHAFKESSRINSTWGGDLTDMVRATRIIETIVEDDLLANVKHIGERLYAGLQEMEGDGLVSNVRGKGMMLAFDLPDGETRSAVLDAAYDERLLSLGSGTKSVRLRPFLDIDTEAAEEYLDRMGRALQKVVSR